MIQQLRTHKRSEQDEAYLLRNVEKECKPSSLLLLLTEHPNGFSVIIGLLSQRASLLKIFSRLPNFY